MEFFYKRILQKDMRCGLSERTVNNVASKNGFENYNTSFLMSISSRL